MLNGLGRFGVRFAALFLLASPAWAGSTLHLQSDAGDPIGKGQTYDYNDLSATFSATSIINSSIGKQVQVIYAYTPGGLVSGEWDLQFAGPLGRALSVGSYDQVQLLSNQIQAAAGLNVIGSLECTSVTGYFDVLDVQTDQFGNITSLAMDFVQYCNGASGALHGQLRYNSTVPLNLPFGDTGAPQSVAEGGTVTLGGADSYPGADGASITSYQWVQLSGPGVTLSDATAAGPTFTAPDVPAGGADLTFQLTVTNSDETSNTSTVTIHVGNPADRRVEFQMQNDPVGVGQVYDYTSLNSLVSVTISASSSGTPDNYIQLEFNGGGEDDWIINVLAPANQPLQAGTRYPLAAIFPTETSNQPGISVRSAASLCDAATATFVVRELTLAQDGKVATFAADFDEQCDAGPPTVLGWIRYNSAIPTGSPMVFLGPNQVSYTGMPVTLDGSASRIGAGEALSYSWTQLMHKGDPVITLSDPSAAKPTFLSPPVPAGGVTVTFQLTVSDPLGDTDSTTMTVKIGNQNDPKSVFYYESDPNDPVGQGTSGFTTSADSFLEVRGGGQLIEAEASDPALPASFSEWEADLIEEQVIPAKVGTYLFNPIGPNTLNINSGTNSCTGATGTVVIRQLTYDVLQNVSSLAMDFMQRCPGATGVLRAVYRYESTVPIQQPPVAVLGANITVTQPGGVTLDSSNSFPGMEQVTYSWKQLSGPTVNIVGRNTPQAHVDLPVSVFTQSGTALVYALTMTNSTGSSTAQITILARAPDVNAFSLQSDAGDPMGQGQVLNMTPADGAISAVKRADDSLQVTIGGATPWTLDFTAGYDKTVRASSFSNVGLYQYGPRAKLPGMLVSTPPRSCSRVSGDFTVLEIGYSKTNPNLIDSLAVNFDQTCNGASGALHGKLRYHSALP